VSYQQNEHQNPHYLDANHHLLLTQAAANFQGQIRPLFTTITIITTITTITTMHHPLLKLSKLSTTPTAMVKHHGTT
jgi:hypothetical protein